MLPRTLPHLSFVLLVAAVACGGSTSGSSHSTGNTADGGSGTEGGGGEGGGGGSSSGGGGGGDDGGSTSTGDDGSAGSTPTPPVAVGANIGTYIVLGDSISDRGGLGPFFYDLLHQNDDTSYPDWKGHDLATKFPGLTYVHAAVAGSISGAYNDTLTTGAPLMSDQIKGLGSSYPGDILVTITIGGNDLNDHAGDAILGLDTPQKQTFTANLKADLDALMAPGRLGSGKVYVLEANIYDSSDGQGDFKKAGGQCPPYSAPASQDVTVFSDWNTIITQGIAAHAGDYLFDIHTLFAGHGFNGSSDWYYTDCIHPNKTGHHQLRKEAWRLVTGETLPD
ncbi:MAG TPA: SGNH/GDSL hydrolase family protein [Polyangiaceae bacterium]